MDLASIFLARDVRGDHGTKEKVRGHHWWSGLQCLQQTLHGHAQR
jgi:hypothetical protein